MGGNTIWSPKNPTASVGFLPPQEKGGVYPSISAEYLMPNHFGVLAEGSWRYHEGEYDGFQPYRPIFYDLNGVYTTHLARRTRGDFMAGIGGETVLFYNSAGGCYLPNGGCRSYFNATHFAVHFGVGVRYSFWRYFFVRPEAHWYFIPNNYEFHSDNVFRVGVSVGYAFGNHPKKRTVRPVSTPQ